MTNDNDIIRESIRAAERFSEIFERHIEAVSAYVARRVGPAASDDIVSETFLIAFRKRRHFDLDRTSALPWLMGIATKVLSQHRRAQARHWRVLQAAFAHSDPIAPDDHDRSSAQLDAAEAIERLYPRIAALSTRDREVLFLHAWGRPHLRADRDRVAHPRRHGPIAIEPYPGEARGTPTVAGG